MKIKELLEEKSKKGTYSGARFSKKTVDALVAFCKEHKIPKAIDGDHLHTTILFSRKFLPDYKAAGKYDEMIVAKPKQWNVWKTSPSDPNAEKTNCLVLETNCPALVERHKELMDEHGGTYDYDEYKTHLTLSYDIGDFDVKDLPLFDQDIEIEEEYQEDLNLDWAAGKGKR